MKHLLEQVNTKALKRINAGMLYIIRLVILVGVVTIGTADASSATTLSGGYQAQSPANAPAAYDLSASLAPQATVALYDVFEITLTASRSYSNPYKDSVGVTATFTGPGGIKQTVRGFWNGAKAFKVRFTPTASGTWTYSTRSGSTPQDPGLSTSGSLLVTAARSGNHGFVRRDANNPYSFVFDDGTRYFMFGQTYYEIMLNALVGDKWKEAVNQSKAHGINKIRMLVYTWGDMQDQSYPDAQPFIGDHDSLNFPYWQRLDKVVQYLGSQGMLADLILFTDSSRTFGTLAQDQRYLRYILSRYAAFPNVIWCLTNEWDNTGKASSYWDSMGRIVRNEDPWTMSKSKFMRPVSIHQQSQADFQYIDSSWPVHAIIQYGVRNEQFTNGDAWGHYGITYNRGHNMPVVNDEYGYIGEPDTTRSMPYPPLSQAKHRNVIWGIVMAGGYASAGDARTFNDGSDGKAVVVYKTANWHDTAEYDDIKHLVDFWTTRGIQYWKMTNQMSRITSGTRIYVLGNPGLEYVVYAAEGGTFGLDLPAGNYQVLRYNPRDGSQVSLPAVSGGRKQFAMPYGGDWVVYIHWKGTKLQYLPLIRKP